VCDAGEEVSAALDAKKKVLAEGANAAMLDIDHGTYPYVTSSAPTVGGAVTGLGVAASRVGNVYGVVKAYTTRVGAGPFPTELVADKHAEGEHMQKVGHEFGTTTGRPRRCGWLDVVVVRYTHRLNGYTAINLTKLDVLTGLKELKIGVAYVLDGKQLAPARMPPRLADLERVEVKYETLPGWDDDISACRKYDELPAAARAYVERVEELAGVRVRWIGVGPGRDAMLDRGMA